MDGDDQDVRTTTKAWRNDARNDETSRALGSCGCPARTRSLSGSAVSTVPMEGGKAGFERMIRP